ncbi:NB-ARC domain-containing protein [Spirillospora sp. CA-294931]|uniref:NB-ARC domain-containing protein n=1 Tax=Spirillospora sp. CA-294931 TaxID=3240042 RepID=UPI003D8FB80D
MAEPEAERSARVVNEMSGGGVGIVVQAGSVGTVRLPEVSLPPVRVPRQLPAAPVGFVNRHAELEALERLVAGEPDRPVVAVVSGLGGVGKTGLVLHWARRVSDRFDGGQLYADLGALRHRGGVDVGDVVGGFLRALGVREEWIPADLAERTSLYRSIAADRRLLVLLDNVEQPAQVTPLVPGSAGSVVVALSRRRLSGLLVSGATLVQLAPLGESAGVQLMGTMLADGRVDDEPEAAAQVVRMCGGLPIALRVCAAHLALRRRHGLGRLSAELEDERRRLERLTSEGTQVVEALFDDAYAALPERTAALYRGLGSHPGPEFSLPVIAFIAGATPDGVAPLVDQLLEASLLEEVGDDRYRFHDLVRLHARGLGQDDARRVVGWYLARTKAADASVMGGRLRLAAPPGDGHVFADGKEALGWLESERTNLLAAVRLAARSRWDTEVWEFAEALWALYDNRAHLADEHEVARLGATSAARSGHAAAEARMHNHVVRALLRAGRLQEAAEALPEALAAAARGGHRRVESAVIETAGLVRLGSGDHEGAIEAFRGSREINAAEANPRGVALQTFHLGMAFADAGRHAEAADALREAGESMAGLGDDLSGAKIDALRGEVLAALGRPDEASAALARAVGVFSARDLPDREAQVLEVLADVSGDADQAATYRRRAAALRAIIET